MKPVHRLTVLSLCALSFLLLASSVLADYQKAYQDYTFQSSQYKDTYNQFLVARSSYQTYGTLTSQQEAIDKFKGVLKSRNQIVSSYYNLLQEKLNESASVSGEQRTTFDKIRLSEAQWLSDNQVKVDAAASLDDLNAVSGEFQSRYPQMLGEGKQAIGMVLLAKEVNLRGQVQAIFDNLTLKVTEIRTSGEDTSVWNRWLFSAQNKLILHDQKIAEVNKQISLANNIDLFKTQQTLSEANQYLRETLTQLQEIINAITI